MARPHGVGWCVPVAVANMTGMTPEQVWLDILNDRRARGRRLTMVKGAPLNDPLKAGGAHAAEALRVLDRAGYAAIDGWQGTRRMSVADFLRRVDQFEFEAGYRGRWLVLQRMHLAAYDGDGAGWHDIGTLVPGLPIAKAWRIEPRYPESDPGDADLELLAGTMALAEIMPTHD